MCSIFVQATAPSQPHIGRVPTGERVMDYALEAPRPWALHQHTSPHALPPCVLKEASASSLRWEGRDLKRVPLSLASNQVKGHGNL